MWKRQQWYWWQVLCWKTKCKWLILFIFNFIKSVWQGSKVVFGLDSEFKFRDAYWVRIKVDSPQLCPITAGDKQYSVLVYGMPTLVTKSKTHTTHTLTIQSSLSRISSFLIVVWRTDKVDAMWCGVMYTASRNRPRV